MVWRFNERTYTPLRREEGSCRRSAITRPAGGTRRMMSGCEERVGTPTNVLERERWLGSKRHGYRGAPLKSEAELINM